MEQNILRGWKLWNDITWLGRKDCVWVAPGYRVEWDSGCNKECRTARATHLGAGMDGQGSDGIQSGFRKYHLEIE